MLHSHPSHPSRKMAKEQKACKNMLLNLKVLSLVYHRHHVYTQAYSCPTIEQ